MDMDPRFTGSGGGDPRSIPELVSDLTGHLATLVRKESELVRTEVGEKIADAGKAGGKMAMGGALLLGAMLVLLQALVLLLSKVMDPVLASLIVGGLVGVAGFMVVKGAVASLSPSHLTPDRTVRQLEKDANLVRRAT